MFSLNRWVYEFVALEFAATIFAALLAGFIAGKLQRVSSFRSLAVCVFWGGLSTTFVISGLVSLASHLLTFPKPNDLAGEFFFGTIFFGVPLTLGILPFVAWLSQAAQKFRWSLLATGLIGGAISPAIILLLTGGLGVGLASYFSILGAICGGLSAFIFLGTMRLSPIQK
jgi:hypothetical protein